jgi:hypothetical protein
MPLNREDAGQRWRVRRDQALQSELPGALTDENIADVCESLGLLLDETDLGTASTLFEAQRFEESVELETPALRAAAAGLASALVTAFQDPAQRRSLDLRCEQLEAWRDAARTDPLPEVRSAWRVSVSM